MQRTLDDIDVALLNRFPYFDKAPFDAGALVPLRSIHIIAPEG